MTVFSIGSIVKVKGNELYGQIFFLEVDPMYEYDEFPKYYCFIKIFKNENEFYDDLLCFKENDLELIN